MEPQPDLSGAEVEVAPPQTLPDILAEAQRLVAAAQARDVTLRLLGGVAIRLRCSHATHRTLNRSYGDIDFVAPRAQGRLLREILAAHGYTGDRRFNALHGDKRLLFFDEARSRQVDVFLRTFEMCHKLPLEDRLTIHPLALSPADLLLTKLQIVQLNTKDVQDILALLLDFEPLASPVNPGEAIDLTIIAGLCANNWGWFTTVHDSLEKTAQMAIPLLAADELATVEQRIAAIKHTLATTPPSLRWRLRSLFGRRIGWYELPEEVQR